MLIWTTIQVFQWLFGTKVSGDALSILSMFGFIELLVEVLAIVAFVCAILYAMIGTFIGDEEELEKKS